MTHTTAKHPAKFSDPILAVIDRHLGDANTVLDPFAGVGRIHELDRLTFGVEIEPEWAATHPRTLLANALALPFPDASFDAVATSPVYGNRMSDHHDAKDGSRRVTYRHSIGHALHPDNSGQLQWGDKYRQFHLQAWTEAIRVIRDGGRFVLNISDHIRAGERMPVAQWHIESLIDLGLTAQVVDEVETPRMRFGANAKLRVDSETVALFSKGPELT